jgi:predicted nucleotidyltransferase
MEIDQAYSDMLRDFFNSKDDITYNVIDLTDDPEKFIFHVKHIVDTRTLDDLDIVFNEDYTKVRVIEFFYAKAKQFNPNLLPPWVWDSVGAKLPPKVTEPVMPVLAKGRNTDNLFS